MSRRPAVLTQADIARAIRAAKQAGGTAVEILSDGTVRVLLTPGAGVISSDEREEIVL